MRRVDGAGQLAGAVKSAASEASRAFGSDVVYLEKYLSRARHVEVQLAGDTHGDLAHLLERDCSLQRRHQKIIEEAPAPFLSSAARDTLHDAGLAAARAVGYYSVGTAEFLVSGDQVYFLEMNTRLQVEHPVTEEITGLDLVGVQLDIAAGARLADLGIPVAASTGHAIEARLYAEDTANGFTPATGTLHHVSFPDLPGVRIESGIESGSVISPYYDSMLAKVVAHGPDRRSAIGLLAQALRATQVDGVTTNRTLLVALLADAEFAAQAGDTQLLERRDIAALSRPGTVPQARAAHALAAALTAHAARMAASPFAAFPPGWRNNPSGYQVFVFADDEGELTVGYRFTRDGLAAQVNGADVENLRTYRLAADSADFEAGGVRRTYHVRRSGGLTYLDSALGSTVMRERERLPVPEPETAPGSLTAAAPGMVLDVLVAEGEQVAEGQPLMVIESMKMETRVLAPYGGTVAELRVRKGALLDTGALLAVVTSGDDAEGLDE
jgi:acetyl/propionyl-CoA carboxylase alpha subunit